MHMTGTDAASRSDTWAPLISLSDVLRFLSGFFFLCAHVHNISPFGILLRFICFSSPLCQSSRLTASQVMEKSHGWVSRFSCLLFFIPLFPAWCTMSWPQSFPSPLFFPKFLFSVVHNPFYPLSLSSPTLSFSAAFILSLICHGPLFAPPIGPHLPIPQQPLTTVCVTGALNLNQCAQVKHMLRTHTHAVLVYRHGRICICRWTLLVFHGWGSERADWWWLWHLTHDAVLLLAMLPLARSVCVKVI